MAGLLQASEAGSSACVACAEGKLSVVDRTSCRDCEAGEFSERDSECIRCPPGRYAPRPQADECLHCGQGSSTNNVSSGATTCTP